MSVDLCNLHFGYKSQRVWNIRHARAHDVIGRDDIDGVRRLRQRLRPPRGRGYFRVDQFIEESFFNSAGDV